MAKYTIISDIGKGMIALLRDKLVPDVLDKSESIGICDPKERGEYIVGIHPYDIREDANGKAENKKSLPDGSIQDAPAMIELYYVISVNSKAGLDSKALDEAKIIGKIIQVIKDNPTIPRRYMPDNTDAEIENVPISMLPLNMEEKVKVWTMFGEPYKLSVFYIVGPVAIDSTNITKPKKRVETIHLSTEHFTPNKVLELATFIKDEDIDDEYTRRPDEDENESEDDYGSDDYGSEDDSFGEDSLGDDSLGEDSLGDESSDDENLEEESLDEENLDDESLDEESLDEESLEDEGLEDESLAEESLDEDTSEPAVETTENTSDDLDIDTDEEGTEE